MAEADGRKPRVLVVYGSVREGRKGIGLARLVVNRLAARGQPVDFADPLELDLPLLRKRYMQYEEGTAPEPMVRMADMIARTEAVVVVSGEYNHGIPPAMKNLLDHYLPEWYHRPAGICCYSGGRFGGVRAAMQLRMTLAELGMVTISSLMPVPNVGDSVSEDGEDRTEWLTRALDAFLDELTWWADAVRLHRERAGNPF